MSDVKEQQVVITATENGPYRVRGPVKLVDPDGNEFDTSGRRTLYLCRCGGSQTKPFCDSTHSKIGFQAAQRAVEQHHGASSDGG